MCDWIRENPPCMHGSKYLETLTLSIVPQQGKQTVACNLSESIAIHSPFIH